MIAESFLQMRQGNVSKHHKNSHFKFSRAVRGKVTNIASHETGEKNYSLCTSNKRQGLYLLWRAPMGVITIGSGKSCHPCGPHSICSTSSTKNNLTIRCHIIEAVDFSCLTTPKSLTKRVYGLKRVPHQK